jgi:UDP-glucuronate 4-epimerase
MTVLLTGAAGFIGFHTAQRLIARGDNVIGIDNFNTYYDPKLKEARIKALEAFITAKRGAAGSFTLCRADIADAASVMEIFRQYRPTRVINLAAQAGVRYSLENPLAYVTSNVTGFTNILEACRQFGSEHLTYASTSSVYGANRQMPFSETHGVDHPLQFYAATKRANELMAHSYSHIYRLPTTGLRFFTVYGPWGRPDMAPWLFTKNIVEGEPINVFNHGNHSRDFTYVSDIADGILRASDTPPAPNWSAQAPDPASSSAPFRLYNIGRGAPTQLSDFIAEIERAAGKRAEKIFLPLQKGDVADTFADNSALRRDTGYAPKTELREGVEAFVSWYKDYHAPPL